MVRVMFVKLTRRRPPVEKPPAPSNPVEPPPWVRTPEQVQQEEDAKEDFPNRDRYITGP